MKKLLFCILPLLLSQQNIIFAQAVSNIGSELALASDNYIRLNYSNDYFTATDYYNTQGILLEYAHPALGKSPLYRLLYKPKHSEMVYGFALEHNAYTPVKYERKEIQYGDRPFAGSLFLKTFTIATNPDKKERLSSSLSAGILGPGAGAKQMQVFIHKNTGNVIPQGWDNQVRNNLVLNYEMTYQKQILVIDNFISLSADGLARIGTLNTKAGIGFTLMAGYFHNPFATMTVKGRKIQFFAYDHPEVNVVGYDATMQGGILNRKSPYVVEARNVARFVFRNNWGFVMKIGKFYLEYYQSFLTKEFDQGMDFRNGGIQIGMGLK